MAKRLNDEDRRPGDEDEDQWVARRHPEVEAAEFEAEQPARDLSGPPKLIISTEAPVKVGTGRLLAGAAVLGVAVVAAAATVAAIGGDGGGPAVVVADERGREVASVPLPEGGRFALRYRHSVYRAEVTETFAAGDGGFRLVTIASPSEAVLDYYELEGRRAATGALWRLEPAASPRLASLPLVATEVGRRTLVVGDRQVPLFASGGAPAHLVLTVRR
jgi:hypothetical protein